MCAVGILYSMYAMVGCLGVCGIATKKCITPSLLRVCFANTTTDVPPPTVPGECQLIPSHAPSGVLATELSQTTHRSVPFPFRGL